MDKEQTNMPSQSPQFPTFNFHYLQNNPQSLTITRPPVHLRSLLFHVPVYIWINHDCSAYHKFKAITTDMLVYCGTVDDAKKWVQGKAKGKGKEGEGEGKEGDGNVVVICGVKDVEEVFLGFDQVEDVKQMLCFDDNAEETTLEQLRRNQQINHRFLKFTNNYEQLVNFLTKTRQQSITQKLLPNFISMQEQVHESNILISTMFAMINQTTDTSRLTEQILQLGRMRTIKEGDQQLFREYMARAHVDFRETLLWYSDERFLYHVLNKLLRAGRHPADIYCLQPFFKNLFHAVQSYYKAERQKKQKFTCYRGGWMSQEQMQFFGSNLGGVVQNLGFLSTSKRRDVGRRFLVNVAFQIEVDAEEREPDLDFGYADISKIAWGNDEQEILFNPLNQFKILSAKNNDSGQRRIFEIELRYGEAARIAVKPDSQLTAEEKGLKYLGSYQMRDFKQIKSMREIIIKTNQNLQGGLQYCHKYLQIATSHRQKSRGFFELGIGYKNLGKLEQAFTCFKKCQAIHRQILGEESIELAIVCDRIGQMHMNKGEYQQALSYLNYALQLKRKLLEPGHIQHASSHLLIGGVYQALKQHDRSLECYKKCEQIQKKVLPSNHPLLAATYNNIGWVYLKMKKYEQSLQYLFQSESIQEEVEGKNQQTLISTYNNIGAVYIEKKHYLHALEWLQKCQRILESNPCINQLIISKLYCNFGSAYRGVSNYPLALQYLKKCLQIEQKLLHQNNPALLLTLNNMAVICEEMGEFRDALACFQRILGIVEAREDGEDKEVEGKLEEVVRVYKGIGVMHANAEKYESGLRYFKQKYQNAKNNLGASHSLSLALHNQIQHFHKQISKILQIYSTLLLDPYSQFSTLLYQPPSTQLQTINEFETVFNKDRNHFVYYHLQVLKIGVLKLVGRCEEANGLCWGVLGEIQEEDGDGDGDREGLMGMIMGEMEDLYIQ